MHVSIEGVIAVVSLIITLVPLVAGIWRKLSRRTRAASSAADDQRPSLQVIRASEELHVLHLHSSYEAGYLNRGNLF